ncbi:hypothetical protein GOBAR_DD24798 [Gossypium barbadense]|nr:hypothetical protein GOBAR_DD24798 [Gossypium barbadense]
MSCVTSVVEQQSPCSDVKVNFDAACNQNLVRSRSGVVVRNSPSEILASKQTLHKEIASAFIAEGYAYFEALLLGNHLGLSLVTIEGDAKTIIKKTHSLAADCLKNGRESYLIGNVPMVINDRLWGRRREPD